MEKVSFLILDVSMFPITFMDLRFIPYRFVLDY